jgi:hypothetical protein
MFRSTAGDRDSIGVRMERARMGAVGMILTLDWSSHSRDWGSPKIPQASTSDRA